MSEEGPIDHQIPDDLGSDDPINALEHQEDFDPFDNDRESVQASTSCSQQAHDEERATFQQSQMRVINERLSGDQTLRRLLMKACQRGHKKVLDKLLELRVRTTGDFGNEVS